MNRRNLFKSLLALPIVFLGSKLVLASEDRLILYDLHTAKKAFSPENTKPIVYWTGTNIPTTSPLSVTFGCGHPGYITKGDKHYVLIHHGIYSSTKTIVTWMPGDKIKYFDCPECFHINFNKQLEDGYSLQK